MDEVEFVVRTATEDLRQRIRRDILMGKLTPGSRLKIQSLAAHYGTSETPVREALRLLASDRLINFEPHRGATVCALSPDFIRNICDIRSALAIRLARRAAERSTPELVADLEADQKAWEATIDAGDMPGGWLANKRLHRRISLAAGNPEALRIIDATDDIVHLTRLRYGAGPEHFELSRLEHRMLIQALQDRDPNWAAAVAERHAERSVADLLQRVAGDVRVARAA